MEKLKRSNLTNRLILTFIAIPSILFLLFWPEKSHIFIIIFVGFCLPIVGSLEFTNLILKKNIKIPLYLLTIINTVIFLFSYFYANDLFNIQSSKFTLLLFMLFLIIVISYIFAIDIFKKEFTKSLEKTALLLLGLVYIGLPSFILPLLFNISFNPVKPLPIFLNIESHGTLTGSLMALFFIVNVFSNDIFAYVFGMAFGRNNTLNLGASPKKSIAGYIGGYLSTLVFVTFFYILFDKKVPILNNPLKILENSWLFYYIIPIFGGIVIPIGDLVESVFKRSSNVKDSGTLILGRGGVLDSMDTIIYFLPFYFIYLQIYFTILS
ncbi:MAG: phosphatidate cytidylyltransferase [Spirochaetes bacterium]|nr:phosphatidate cytidylyltransferase [Spirochaetota bacterium]